VLAKLSEAYAYNTALIILLIKAKILQFYKSSQQKAANSQLSYLTPNCPTH